MFSITEIWFFQMRNFVSPGCSYPCNCLILSRQADFCTRANLVNKVKSPSRLTLKKAFCMKKLGVCQIACPNCLRAWRSPYITCSLVSRVLCALVLTCLVPSFSHADRASCRTCSVATCPPLASGALGLIYALYVTSRTFHVLWLLCFWCAFDAWAIWVFYSLVNYRNISSLKKERYYNGFFV